MFLLKLLGVLDLMAVAGILLLHFNYIPAKVVFPFSMYLAIKAVAFRDVASILDMAAALYVLGMIFFGFHTFAVYLFAAYLFQKAVFSFF